MPVRQDGKWVEKRAGTDLDKALRIHARLGPALLDAAKLPKGIYKRGSLYYARYREGGQWKHRSAGPELGAALDLQAEILDGRPPSDAVKLADLVERYLKRLETYFKQSTVRTHRTVSRNLLRFFRNRPVETWTSGDLETYIQQRLEKVAPTTVNGELKNLKATLRFAVEEKLIAEMPFKIRMLPVVQRRTARIFTREEIQRLLDSADDRTRALLLIASATGMRIGEIRHLQWRDIDSEQRRILVRAKEDWTPKTNQERICFVSAEVIDELHRYRQTLKHNSDSDWVFQNKLKPGERWRETGNAYYGIHRAFKRAGLYRKGKLTHEIRRAVASTMLLNGTPIHVVKEILGHSTIKTTELYAFTNEEAKKEAVKNALI
ncbi:MAG: tyrosine-type recombinase/integrase [Myxococcales bacterium]|nr:tyrosine-type recombinase/integrase [Myxococcales bacterium]